MELKPGYKLTEVGVIPEDWETKNLMRLCETIVDCAHSTPVWTSSGAIVLRNQNIRSGKLDLLEPSYTDEIHFAERTRRATPSENDLVFTREAPMGEVCLIPPGLRCCLGQRMVLLRPNQEECVPKYLLYELQSEPIHQFIRVNGGTGSTVGNLRIPLIEAIPIPVPPLSEQRSIATALSDMDELLGACDRLIAKKRDLKQATMQQLLTGKTRLPGFDGEWKVKRLGDVLTICHGRSQHEVQVEDGPYPILATGGQIGTAKRFLYDKPSVLIGRKGTIDQPQYMNTPFWTVDTLFYSIVHDSNNAKFIFYCFCLINWYQYNEASGVPSLSAKTIESIEFNCPQPEEQTAIATILSDMDAEIAALEQRRDKTRALKQAMMQELLTGRIRLV